MKQLGRETVLYTDTGIYRRAEAAAALGKKTGATEEPVYKVRESKDGDKKGQKIP